MDIEVAYQKQLLTTMGTIDLLLRQSRSQPLPDLPTTTNLLEENASTENGDTTQEEEKMAVSTT